MEWRVSLGNLEFLKEIHQKIEDSHGEESKDILHTVGLMIEDMKRGLSSGQDFVRMRKDLSVKKETLSTPISLSRARPLLLMDAFCASATLDFIDLAIHLPRAETYGQTTGADTKYLEVRTLRLPSDKGILGFGVNVHRNRSRGSNVPHIPQNQYNGDISDTKAVKAWLINQLSNG